MGAESHYGMWLVGIVIVFIVGGLLFDTLVALPGRFLIRLLAQDFETTHRMSRAVGMGIWSVLVMIIYAITS